MKKLIALLALVSLNAMATDYYAASGNPATGAALSSAVMRAEFTSIAAGFAKLAPYTSNANGIVVINGTGTGQTIVAPGSGVLTALTQAVSGSGGFCLTTNCSLVTPTLGVASATSINKITLTQPATGATLTLVDGSTLATSGAFSTTLTATAATNVTLPTTGTLATLAGAESLTNKKLGSLTSNGLVTTSAGDGTLSVTVPGTGVLTALGVNVGSAGSFVVNGGALGSPSSAGTLPAFTLGGNVTGNAKDITGLGALGATSATIAGDTRITSGNFYTNNGIAFGSNLYYSGGWKYAGNGIGFTFLDVGNKATLYIGNAVNAGGAGAAATVINAWNVDTSGNLSLGTNSLTAGAATVTTLTASVASAITATLNRTTSGSQVLSIQNSGTEYGLVGSNSSIAYFASTGNADLVLSADGTSTSHLTINHTTGAVTIPGTLTLTNIASDSTHTDATVCVDTTSKTLYYGSGALGVCLGTSSTRYKTHIAALSPGLSEILALQPVSYRLKRDPSKVLYGFTAEQGGQVLPELLGLDAEGRANTFDYLGVVPVLVKAVQEQQAEIETLKRRLPANDAIYQLTGSM